MIVVDSSVWIANLRREPSKAVARLRQPDVIDQVLVGDIVLLEVLQGARDDRQAALLEAGLRQFPVVAMLGADMAIAAARHYRQLSASGFTMNKIADLIIGTFCIAHDHTLLHCDADFVPMQICGLRFP
jgi:predicted nucleic acid-binding protein